LWDELDDQGNKKPQTVKTRAHTMHRIFKAGTEDFFEAGQIEVCYLGLKLIAKRFYKFLMEQPESLKTILSIEDPEKSISHHGVVVASIAIQMAKAMGIKDDKKIQLLATGAAVHDIGHYISKIGSGIQKPVAQMSEFELASYKKHPLT